MNSYNNFIFLQKNFPFVAENLPLIPLSLTAESNGEGVNT